MLISADCRRCSKPFEFERVSKPKLYCDPCRPEAQLDQIRAWQATKKAARPPKRSVPKLKPARPLSKEAVRKARVQATRAKGCETCGGGVSPPRQRFCGFRRKPATHSDAKPASVPI